MINKRIFALVLAVMMVFSLSACGGNDGEAVTQESTTVYDNTTNENVSENVFNTDVVLPETTTEYYTQSTYQPSSVETTMVSIETETTTTQIYDETADWSKERIVEEYKTAARKSQATAVSIQRITIKDMSVNDGEHENVMSFIGKIIGSFLESNSTETQGITGGYENLVAEDVMCAKAYKNGDNITIELNMVDQTSGVNENALSGSVGHAITAVGDISAVVEDLANRGLPLELSEEETKIYYTNASVKVVINENGEIISGTWRYTVEISMNNFKAFGQNVNKASIIMDNTITV